MKLIHYLFLAYLLSSSTRSSTNADLPVAEQLSRAQTPEGQYISWQEHIIDDAEIGGVELSGSDGLSVGDLDNDGFPDIVSVHESDTEYDETLEGHIRIAFGSADPDQWELITLAQGAEAAAAEDVAIEDINGDGYADIVAACELAHLIYFQNPATEIRSARWPRIIPSVTKGRGSFIRVFAADFNQDGQPEIVAANKGDQLGSGKKDSEVTEFNAISYFELNGNPLEDSAWVETELIRVKIPINSQPVDMDGDGDLDIIAGSRGENRIILFENVSDSAIRFEQHPIRIHRASLPDQEAETSQTKTPEVSGINMDFWDVNQDGRLDIFLTETINDLAISEYIHWLEQPSDWTKEWVLHQVGSVAPDRVIGLAVADINSDGKQDVITGGYSSGSRREDNQTIDMSLGRIAWFEQPANPNESWIRHDISRRKRGMFDKFISIDLDKDGDVDFLSTRGNSVPYDGVFWLEQIRTNEPTQAFVRARPQDSEEMPLLLVDDN